MNVIILQTKRGLPIEKVAESYQDIGTVYTIEKFEDVDAMRGSLYLTHIPSPTADGHEQMMVKVQNALAWNKIIHGDFAETLVVLDTVRVNTHFARSPGLPSGADIGILSPSNMRINGIHLNGTNWVFLDSDDPDANNICNAYIVTRAAASKLFSRRNEMLSDNVSFARYINSISNYLATDRITTYMSLNGTSSKPIYIS